MTGINTAKVSVVIPIWNTEKYLEKCLDSVCNQTLKNIEIICVNNGSTDSCTEILEKFSKKDRRIKILTIEHGCISKARNAGISIASAPYITFVDSDDWVISECYEYALKEFEKDDDIDLVCWGANVENLNLDKNSQYLISQINYHKIKFKGKIALNDNIIYETNVCVWNKMFKKDIIMEKGISFPENVELEDNSFFYTYTANCKYAYYIDKYFYNYVQRKGSGFEKLNAGESDIVAPNMKNLIFIIKYLKSKNLFDNKQKFIKRLFIRGIKGDIIRTKEQNYRTVLDKALEAINLINDENFMKQYINSLKIKNYTAAVDILKGKYVKLFGNNIFGIYKQEITSRYQLKFFGIKIKFRLAEVN